MQLLMQLLVPGADPAPSSIGLPVGQDECGDGTQHWDRRDGQTTAVGTATFIPCLPSYLLASWRQTPCAHCTRMRGWPPLPYNSRTWAQ